MMEDQNWMEDLDKMEDQNWMEKCDKMGNQIWMENLYKMEANLDKMEDQHWMENLDKMEDQDQGLSNEFGDNEMMNLDQGCKWKQIKDDQTHHDKIVT